MPPTQLSPIHPSPKRKRDQPNIPLLNTTLRTASTPPRGSPTPDSPRNAVADQLRGMSIAAIPMSPLIPEGVVPKKPKLGPVQDGGGALTGDPGDIDMKSWKQERTIDNICTRTASLDNATGQSERPQSQSQSNPLQQPRTLADSNACARPTIHGTSGSKPTSVPKSTPSSLSNTSPKSEEGSCSSGPRAKSPSPPLYSLTWQDDEITGHLVDPAMDPEDDGTGLNGIGFRPTPAIAHARAQKRRQQLMEWRARESRDARAKRSERRRRGVGGFSREGTAEPESAPKAADAAKRAVRFAI